MPTTFLDEGLKRGIKSSKSHFLFHYATVKGLCYAKKFPPLSLMKSKLPLFSPD